MEIETVKIDDKELDNIYNLEESHFVDLKSKEIKPSKLTKSISGFANAVGGELYIGIREKENNGYKIKVWDGFKDVEEANGHIQAFEERFPLTTKYSYTFLYSEKESGLVLQVIIHKTQDIIESSEGVIYQRAGAQNIPLREQNKIDRLRLDKGVSSFEDETLDTPIDFVSDSYKIFEFMLEVVSNSEPLPWLKKQLLIHDEKPKAAAVLLFADEPQAALSKRSGLKIYRYKSKAEYGTRETLAFDPISIEGPIYDQIYEAVKQTITIIEEGKILNESGLQNVKYPYNALHEIVTNALLHRDYSILSDIHIRIFDNRVEIESPGALSGHITKENILNEQFARNGTIVRLVNKFPDPPNKDVGEGLNTAFDEIKQLRLQKPEIIEKENSLLVIIKHESLASPEEIVMGYLEEHEEIHNKTARELTGIASPDSMKQVFYKLQKKGLVYKNPDPKKRGMKTTWLKNK